MSTPSASYANVGNAVVTHLLPQAYNLNFAHVERILACWKMFTPASCRLKDKRFKDAGAPEYY